MIKMIIAAVSLLVAGHVFAQKTETIVEWQNGSGEQQACCESPEAAHARAVREVGTLPPYVSPFDNNPDLQASALEQKRAYQHLLEVTRY